MATSYKDVPVTRLNLSDYEDKKKNKRGRKYRINEDGRIVSLKKFVNSAAFHHRSVNIGDVGGYVDGYHNLSQKGTCWISDDARAMNKSQVLDDAMISGNAVVSAKAKLRENSAVYDYAAVYGRADIYGKAVICEHVKVYDNAEVCGKSFIDGTSVICGNANVSVGVTPGYIIDGSDKSIYEEIEVKRCECGRVIKSEGRSRGEMNLDAYIAAVLGKDNITDSITAVFRESIDRISSMYSENADLAKDLYDVRENRSVNGLVNELTKLAIKADKVSEDLQFELIQHARDINKAKGDQ